MMTADKIRAALLAEATNLLDNRATLEVSRSLATFANNATDDQLARFRELLIAIEPEPVAADDPTEDFNYVGSRHHY